jgi:hypothetical protein
VVLVQLKNNNFIEFTQEKHIYYSAKIWQNVWVKKNDKICPPPPKKNKSLVMRYIYKEPHLK